MTRTLWAGWVMKMRISYSPYGQLQKNWEVVFIMKERPHVYSVVVMSLGRRVISVPCFGSVWVVGSRKVDYLITCLHKQGLGLFFLLSFWKCVGGWVMKRKWTS